MGLREVAYMEIQRSYIEIVSMLEQLYSEVNGYEFYRYIFPDNENSGEQYTDFSHPNAIYLYKDGQRFRRRIMLSDVWEQDYMEYVEENSFTLCSGISYRGRYNRLQNAQCMNALVFDLDGVGAYELRNLLLRFDKPAEWIRTMPMPTFLVASGAGLHIYYVFEEPVNLFPNIKLQMKALKYDLTFRLWEYKSTSTKEQIQYQSINQMFRMVGSVNGKYGNRIRAFQVGEKMTLDYINRYADPANRVDSVKPFRPSKMTREEAKVSYPEWYQRVVVEQRKGQKKWDIKSKQGYALYEWWIRQIGKVKGGHRYYFMMCMVIYAYKCDVPREKLEDDLYAVYEQLRFVEHDNPLTEDDIHSALEAYDKEYYNFTIKDIEMLTDIRISRNKRNRRKQKQHMEIMRAIQSVVNPEWRRGNGRPSAEKEILAYIEAHPEARKVDVIRGTGRDKKTVYKYYDRIKQRLQGVENNEMNFF